MVARAHEQISLSRLERVTINLFTLYDIFHASGLRSRFGPQPTLFDSYYKKLDAQTVSQRWRAILYAHSDKTKKLIYAKERHGEIPEAMQRMSKRSPCGYLRLLVAFLH